MIWIYVIPKFRGYRIRQEALILDNGAVSHKLVKVPVDELQQWDDTHDAVGHDILQTGTTHDVTDEKAEKAFGRLDF